MFEFFGLPAAKLFFNIVVSLPCTFILYSAFNILYPMAKKTCSFRRNPDDDTSFCEIPHFAGNYCKFHQWCRNDIKQAASKTTESKKNNDKISMGYDTFFNSIKRFLTMRCFKASVRENGYYYK